MPWMGHDIRPRAKDSFTLPLQERDFFLLPQGSNITVPIFFVHCLYLFYPFNFNISLFFLFPYVFLLIIPIFPRPLFNPGGAHAFRIVLCAEYGGVRRILFLYLYFPMLVNMTQQVESGYLPDWATGPEAYLPRWQFDIFMQPVFCPCCVCAVHSAVSKLGEKVRQPKGLHGSHENGVICTS
jgi:hypothetical protein